MLAIEDIIQNLLQDFWVSENTFAEAYESVPAPFRSRLKKCIAHLINWYGLQTCFSQTLKRTFKDGLVAYQTTKARNWTVIWLLPDFSSPSQLIAAVVPALLAGVENVLLLARDQHLNRKSLLVAMELAGLENVFCCPQPQQLQVLKELMHKAGKGTIIGLGKDSSPFSELYGQGLIPHQDVNVGYMRGPDKIGVWADNTSIWDFEAIDFSLPNLPITVWSQEELILPGTWSQSKGKWSQFLQENYDLMYVPAHGLEMAVEKTSLVFAPGQEGSWIWTELDLQLFLSAGAGWTEVAHYNR